MEQASGLIGQTQVKREERQEWIRSALRQYERPLMRYATRLLGSVDRGSDVVQDTFLRLCRQKPAQIRGHLAEWLFTVCRNRALDVLRKENKMNPLPDARLETEPSREPGPLRKLEAKEGLSRVVNILETLPCNQQEVVRLKFQSGLSYREISRVTGLSEGNVGFLLHTALKQIRQRTEKEPASSGKHIRRIK